MGVIATSDGLAPGLERLEVEQIVEVAVLNDMRLLIAPVEIARGGEHNSATFRIIQQPASLDGYVCRAEVETSEGTTYRLVTNGEFSLTSDIAVPGIGSLQLVYSDGAAVIRKTYPARFHVTRSLNAVDESDPEYQNGLAQLQSAAFAQVRSPGPGDTFPVATFLNISGQPVGILSFPPGQGAGLDEPAANLLYVRQDGTSVMSGDLRMVGSTADAPIGIYIGGRFAQVRWENALQLRRGQAGEPVQVANNDGSQASAIVTEASGDARYLREINANSLYLALSGGQMGGPLITATGTGLTNPGIGIGDNSTGFYRAGNTLLLSVGGALYAQWLQAPASVMFTVPLNMATYPITNVGAPNAATDAANRAYVDNAVAAVPRQIVPAVRTYIGTEVTIGSALTELFNQPFFTNDNAQRTILVTVQPQFAAGTQGAFYDLEYTCNIAPGVVEKMSVYPTPNGYMGGGAVACFAANVTPASAQIQIAVSVREISNNVTQLVQIGGRADARSYIVIQEMTT